MTDEGFKISVQDEKRECLRTPQLSSKQEKADTKMFLAANYACNRAVESVTIHTVDSDVAILACYYAPIIESRIIIKIETGKYEQMLNVIESSLDENLIRSLPGLHAFSGCESTSAFHLNLTESSLDENLICSLPGLHAFSGCDSTSALHGIGKIKWLNLVKKNMKFFVILYAYLVKALI